MAQAIAALAAGIAGFGAELAAIRVVPIPSAALLGGGGAIIATMAAGLLVAPLVSGFAGGLASRHARAAVGSFAGFLAGLYAAYAVLAVLDGKSTLTPTFASIVLAALFAVPVVMGHLTGALLRPHRTPA